MIKLEAQCQVWALRGIAGQVEIIIFITRPVITGTQPDVGDRTEADG